MKKILFGFALVFTVSPLFADWTFGNGPNSGSGFSFGSRPNSGSGFSFGNGPNSGFSFGDGFNVGDGFNYGSTPHYNSGWNNNSYGYGYRPYPGDKFHRNPVSGFSFGNNSQPYWNQGTAPAEIKPPAWMPPAYSNYYPAYITPPSSSMYYYPVPPVMPKAPEQPPIITPPAPVSAHAESIPMEKKVETSPEKTTSPIAKKPK